MTKLTGNEIKKEILAHVPSLKSRDISVSTKGSIRIKLKAFTPISKIEAIVSKYQRIDRCEATGDILSGANTFVFVEYSYDLKITEELEKTIRQVRSEYSFSDTCNHLSRQHHIKKALSEVLEGYTPDDCGYILAAMGYEKLKELGLR